MDGHCKVGGIVVREAVGLRKSGQFEDFRCGLWCDVNWKGFEAIQEAFDLIHGNSLAAIGHQQAVTNFVKLQERYKGALFGEAGKDCQAVLSFRFVCEEPLKGE